MKRFIPSTPIFLAFVLLVACSTPTTMTQLSSHSNAISQSSSISANQPTRSPNIVFILTDDLDVAEIAYMPKLQELMVKPGASFNNALVNVSLCCPSRSTILRGQYSQNTQIIGNNLPDGGYEKFHSNGDEGSTIATWLKDAGYRTMLAGKYLNGYPGPVSQTFVPPGWSEWYSAAKGNAYGEYNYILNENGKLVEYKNKPEDYGTDVYTRKTIDFIQRTTKEGKPFFVYFAPYAPHSPQTPAPRHEKLFADEMLPRPLNFNEADVSDKPAYIKNRPKLSERQINQIQDAYRDRLRSLQAVDDMIGNLFDTLKQTGQLDNTYVFFMSDNGFHLGNHRLANGKWTPYEEDVHVPLIVRGPGVPANVRLDHIVGNSDLAPTWADLARIQAPGFIDGRSFVSLLKSNPPSTMTAWRQCYLISRGDPDKDTAPDENESVMNHSPEMEGLLEPPDTMPFEVAGPMPQGAVAVPAFQGLHTQFYKYVEYKTGEKELYDLRVDPYELNNLAAKANPDLLTELATRLHELEKCSAANCRAIEEKPFTLAK